MKNMLEPNILLITLLVSGAVADCPLDPHIFITAPRKMEALSGSCLQIPCNFTPKKEKEFDSSREIFGVWIKSDRRFALYPDNVIFNSSNTVNTYPMTITGNLRQRNCTTLFSSLVTDYTNKYYFRIENTPFMATASCNETQITVQDSPARPRIEVPAGLKEKQSVTITCSAFTPCPHSPPQLTWSLQQHPHNYMKDNPDGTFTRQIQETITLSDHHDGSRISCSVTYPVNEGRDVKTAEETVTLSVSYAPKDTSVSVSPSGLVSAGTWVNLTCSSRARPPVRNFTWFKISTDGVKPVAEGAVYSLNVTEGEVYFCEAQNDVGKEKSPEKTLSVRGMESSSSLWAAVVGTITGITVVICVVVAIWWLKSKRQNSHNTQSLTVEETATSGPAKEPEKEDIHYGVINFSMGGAKPSSNPSQNGGQQQETLYAEVNVSSAANSTAQPTAGHSDAIYAQVRKK
ncbi:uncharacterized protein V6R79_000025 [Siganus canaliculatus]